MNEHYLRHIVVLFKRRHNDQEYTTVIDADPTKDHFPHVTFDLRTEAANPYPSGTVSITNFHELGVAALPGGICVVRAGYHSPEGWPPVIYAGRPFSLETEWRGTDSKTTLGLGLPGELFNEVTVGPTGRIWSLRRLLEDHGQPGILFDTANLRDQLQYNGQEIRVPKGYAAGPAPNQRMDDGHTGQ